MNDPIHGGQCGEIAKAHPSRYGHSMTGQPEQGKTKCALNLCKKLTFSSKYEFLTLRQKLGRRFQVF